MDSPGPSAKKCGKKMSETPSSDCHPWTCFCEKCMPLADDGMMKGTMVEEDSVHRNVGDDASMAEIGGELPSEDEKDTYSSDSYEGRLRECGRLQTISSPPSNATPSVHLSRHYFMLDGRIYWSRTAPPGRRSSTQKPSVDMKLEKLVQCGDARIQDSPSLLPDSADGNPSINMAHYTSATSRHPAEQSALYATSQSPTAIKGVACQPHQQNSRSDASMLDGIPTSRFLHSGQFVPWKRSPALVRPWEFNRNSGCSAATVDLDDEDASAPFLHHISELVEDIVQKGTTSTPPPSAGDASTMLRVLPLFL
jgi:hypothetical protein